MGCQVHFFNAPTPKTLYGQLNWRITEPDGEFFTRDTIQRFVEDEKRPGILYNHDNEYLHYQDDWYILDHPGRRQGRGQGREKAREARRRLRGDGRGRRAGPREGDRQGRREHREGGGTGRVWFAAVVRSRGAI